MGRIKVFWIFLAEEGNEAGVDLTVVDVIKVLGDAVKKIVGDYH